MARKPATSSVKALREPANAEKMAEMLRDRARGMSYSDLAAKYGYQTRGGCYRAIQKTLAATIQEPADELRVLERERLLILYREAIRQMEMDHPVLWQGDDTGYVNEGAKLAALDRALKISERLAKLEGLDAPTRHEVLSIDAIDAEIARLNSQLAGRVATATADATAGAEG